MRIFISTANNLDVEKINELFRDVKAEIEWGIYEEYFISIFPCKNIKTQKKSSKEVINKF